MKDNIITYTEAETQLMCQNYLFAFLQSKHKPLKNGWCGVRWWKENKKKKQDSVVPNKIKESLNTLK